MENPNPSKNPIGIIGTFEQNDHIKFGLLVGLDLKPYVFVSDKTINIGRLKFVTFTKERIPADWLPDDWPNDDSFRYVALLQDNISEDYIPQGLIPKLKDLVKGVLGGNKGRVMSVRPKESLDKLVNIPESNLYSLQFGTLDEENEPKFIFINEADNDDLVKGNYVCYSPFKSLLFQLCMVEKKIDRPEDPC